MYSKMEERMEELTDEDEARERYEQLYLKTKAEIDRVFYHLGEKAHEEISKLKKRFNAIRPEFETWDEIKEGILDMMFPDQEDGIYEIE